MADTVTELRKNLDAAMALAQRQLTGLQTLRNERNTAETLLQQVYWALEPIMQGSIQDVTSEARVSLRVIAAFNALEATVKELEKRKRGK